MLDVKIDCLRINVENAAGHEHRIRPIAQRAAQIFAGRLGEYVGSYNTEELRAASVGLDLGASTDEGAARVIADAWLDALAIKLR
jgi:hypothetical protein